MSCAKVYAVFYHSVQCSTFQLKKQPPALLHGDVSVFFLKLINAIEMETTLSYYFMHVREKL